MRDNAIGFDAYNQTLTGEVSKTMNSIKSDADHVPCVMIPLTEKRFFDWHPDEVSVTLREKSGSYGGGERSAYCERVCGSLCYDDYKGLNRQAVEQGKWVVMIENRS